MTRDTCPLCEEEITSLNNHLTTCEKSDRIFEDTETPYAR